MKTLLCAGAFAAFGAHITHATPTLAQTFAGCAGRYSAQLEHAWLMRSPDSARHQTHQQKFVALLDAVADPEQVSALLHRRIQAKHAHASLLGTATFAQDERRKKAADAQARQHIITCQKMLLGS